MSETLTGEARKSAEARQAHRQRLASDIAEARQAERQALARGPEDKRQALASLTKDHLDAFARIAKSEARRSAGVSVDADDLASEALLRMADTDTGALALMGTPARSTAEARYRMHARSLVSASVRRACLPADDAEAERAEARQAALAADGQALRGDRDSGRRWQAEAHAGDQARLAKVREVGNLLPHDVGSEGGPVRILRETSLESLLTEAVKPASAYRDDSLSAGRTERVAETDPMTRALAWRALALTASDLAERAAEATEAKNRAEATVWHAFARLLGAPEAARQARAVKACQRSKAATEATEATEAASKAHKLTAHAGKAGKGCGACRTLAERLAAERAAERAASERYVLASALAQPSPTLASVLAAAVSVSDRGKATLDYRQLALLAHGEASDTATARMRRALRSLAEDAEDASGYVGLTAEALASLRGDTAPRQRTASPRWQPTPPSAYLSERRSLRTPTGWQSRERFLAEAARFAASRGERGKVARALADPSGALVIGADAPRTSGAPRESWRDVTPQRGEPSTAAKAWAWRKLRSANRESERAEAAEAHNAALRERENEARLEASEALAAWHRDRQRSEAAEALAAEAARRAERARRKAERTAESEALAHRWQALTAEALAVLLADPAWRGEALAEALTLARRAALASMGGEALPEALARLAALPAR